MTSQNARDDLVKKVPNLTFGMTAIGQGLLKGVEVFIGTWYVCRYSCVCNSIIKYVKLFSDIQNKEGSMSAGKLP